MMTKHSELIERLKYLAEGYEMDDPEALREAITALSHEPVQSEELGRSLSFAERTRANAYKEIAELQSRIEELTDLYEKGNAALAVQVKRAVKAEAQIKEYVNLLSIICVHVGRTLSDLGADRELAIVFDEMMDAQSTRIAAMTGEDE